MLPIISSDMFSSILFSFLTTMISGVETLKELDSNAISELNLLGDRLRERLQQIGDDSNQQIMIAGKGSLFQIHFTDDSVRDWRSSGASGPLSHAMRHEGILLAPHGMGNLSTAMDDEDIEMIAMAFERALESL